MITFFGIIVFIAMVVLAFKVGAVALKILFTIIGAIVGIVALLPLGFGLGLFLLIPAVVIGIIACIIKCLKIIF